MMNPYITPNDVSILILRVDNRSNVTIQPIPGDNDTMSERVGGNDDEIVRSGAG